MSLAYPTGECFFKRKGLDTSQPEGFHASDIKQFPGRMLVEFIWNWPCYHGATESNWPTGWSHSRSNYAVGTASWWATKYGQWEVLPFSYGPDPGNIKRRNEHNLCLNANRFKDVEQGASLEPWFMAMPMPTKEERWVWIDLLAYIRAIYIPVSYYASPDYPELCTYVHINFTRMKQAEIWANEDKQEIIPCDATKGLIRRPGRTLGLDIYGLAQMLSIPRQLRKGSPFQSRLLRVVPFRDVKTVPVQRRYYDKYDFDWPTVCKANFGIDVQWRPATKTEWWEKFVKDAITLSVSFIPVAGPFLAIAFPLGWTLIRDPNAFVQEIRNVVPGADISAQLVEQIEKEAIELRAFLLDDWQKLMLPSQGAAQESTIGVKLPMVSIGIGQKPEPDGEREASKQVFPADKPPRLDSETPKNDAFVLFQAMMDALGKQATWAPSTEEYTLELQIEAGDLAKAEGIVPEIDEVQPFGG